MRNFKKVIAAGLALLMLALSVNVTFAAENYSDAEAVAVAKVNAAKIMTGTDKGFEPSKTLTRAEAAAIFVRMKGISESTVKQSAGSTLFTDVAASHWAAGYINVASNYGIIVGVGAGKFAPEKEVTVAEFYTMAVRALGAGKLVDSEGTWPTNYVNFAIENDLAEDVAQVYTATATRISAAIIAANTLEANMWEKSAVKSNGEITWEAKNKQIVEDVLKLKAYVNKAAVNKETTSIKVSGVSNVDKTITDGTNTLNAVKDLDLSSVKFGMTYEYWTNKDDEIVGLWIPTTSDRIEFTEIKKYAPKTGKDEITLVVDGKETIYKVDDSSNTTVPTVVYNEVDKNATSSNVATLLGEKKNIRGVAYLDDGVLSQVYMTEFTTFAAVKEATAKKVTYQTASEYVGFATTSLSLTTTDKEYFLTKDGEAMEFADLDEDDVIKYYTVSAGAGKIVAEVVEPTLTGKVQSFRKDGQNLKSIKIDGTTYDVVNPAWDIKADDEITIYLNDAGKVAAYIKDKKATASYGFVNYARTFNGTYGKNLEVSLVLSDGTITDKMTIDTDETKEEFDVDSSVANHATAAAVNYGTDGKAIITHDSTTKTVELGAMVCYEIKNGKLVIKPESVGADAEFDAITNDDSTVKNLVITNKTMKIGSYFLTDNTRVFKLKTITNKAYEYAVEEIAIDDLDDTAVLTGSYVAGIDKDTNEIETLYISANSSVARTGEANFAFITKVWDTKDGDDNVKEIEVILLDGSKETYIVSTDRVLGNGATVAAGKFVDLTVNNGKVTKLDDLTITVTGETADDNLDGYTVSEVVKKAITGKRYQLAGYGSIVEKAVGTTLTTNDKVDDAAATAGASTQVLYMTTGTLGTDAKLYTTVEKAYNSFATHEILLGDDVLVLEANKLSNADKWTVRDISDIEIYGDGQEYFSSNAKDVVTYYATYKADQNDVDEVTLVIFVNDVEPQA